MTNYSGILAVEPYQQYEKAKIYDTGRWNPPPQVGRCPICRGPLLIQKEWSIWPKEKWHSVVDVSGGESDAWCCKEQYCLGTWNVSSWIKVRCNFCLMLIRTEHFSVWAIVHGVAKSWTWLSTHAHMEFKSPRFFVSFISTNSI